MSTSLKFPVAAVEAVEVLLVLLLSVLLVAVVMAFRSSLLSLLFGLVARYLLLMSLRLVSSLIAALLLFWLCLFVVYHSFVSVRFGHSY